jgi:flavin-dependent dehydrogenase
LVKPVVVIGGGLAGAAAATRLARHGRSVVLLEREQGPHEKVCGEFLSIEACQHLEDLGLAPAALGAVPMDRVRLHHGHLTREAPLPFVAHGLSRKVLDEALLETAAAAGAHVTRGVRVTGLRGGTVLSSHGEYEASEVLLATGKHDLRGLPRPSPAGSKGYIGLKMHWRCSAAVLAQMEGAIELVVFDGGYAGLQRVGAWDINMCLVIRRDRFAELGSTWPSLLEHLLREPILARRLGEAEPRMARPLAIANLPYGFVHEPHGGEAPDVWRLGDQVAMTASLTGDGMAIALRSAQLAAEALVGGASATAYHRHVAAQAGGQVRRAMRLQRAAESPWARAVGTRLVAAWPGLLTWAAQATRLPAHTSD